MLLNTGQNVCVLLLFLVGWTLIKLHSQSTSFSSTLAKKGGHRLYMRQDAADQPDQKALPVLQNRSAGHLRWKMLINLSVMKDVVPG